MNGKYCYSRFTGKTGKVHREVTCQMNSVCEKTGSRPDLFNTTHLLLLRKRTLIFFFFRGEGSLSFVH